MVGSLLQGVLGVPSCAGLNVNLVNPQVVGSGIADNAGDVTIPAELPPELSSFTAHFQVGELASCRVTNVTTQSF